MSRQYKHVSLSERIEIEKSLDLGRSQAEIARRLGRSRSTISREIARRSWRASNTSAAYTPYRPAALRTGEWTQRHYRATSAQAHAGRAAQRCHQPRRMRHDRLVAYVRDHLRRGWTPEEIAGRLPLEFADDPAMRVSHETVYAWIYAPTQKGLQLWQYLPRGQRKRRQRGPARKVRRAPQIRYRVPIHHRPIEVEDRTEFGHWEADSVLGVRGQRGAAHRGRTNQQVRRRRQDRRRGSRPHHGRPTGDDRRVARARREVDHRGLGVPPARRSRAGGGSEFAWHYKLADATGVPTYFAVPYSSWQRGTNEHFNGRIRKYLPKRTRLDTITDAELADIIAEINNRPRKILGWHTPAEVFHRLCSTQPHPVALQI